MARVVTLTRGDGSESFTIPAKNVERTTARDVAIKGLEGGIGELVGGTPRLQRDKFTITFDVTASISSDDYPNDTQYDGNDAFGFTEELHRASREWDPISAGRDTLQYRDFDNVDDSLQQAQGYITEVQTGNDVENDGPENYTNCSLQFTQLDIYFEQGGN